MAARSFDDYVTMTEHAIEKAQQALNDGNQGLFGLHLSAASAFADLANATATMALATATKGGGSAKVKDVPSNGYL